MLDGDRIAALVAEFIMDQIKKANLQSTISIGIVQTAYANGSSTSFFKDKLGTSLEMTPTGVKYLHHAAKNFDIGIYFEANGHGTVLFSENFKSVLQTQG